MTPYRKCQVECARTSAPVGRGSLRADGAGVLRELCSYGGVWRGEESVNTEQQFEYDIAISYAGEDSAFVEQVAHRLHAHGVRLFFGPQRVTNLWGRDLTVEFAEIFSRRSRRVLMFISQHYARKFWPQQEAAAAFAGHLRHHERIILPVRFDDTEVPGLLPTIGYVDARHLTPLDVANETITLLTSLGLRIGPPLVSSTVARVEAGHPLEDQELTIAVRDEGGPVHGADVLVLYPNSTYVSGHTDQQGAVRFALHTGGGLTLYLAASGHRAHLLENFAATHALEVYLPRYEGGGSEIFAQGTGHIPVILGRLNPVGDARSGASLWADNVAVSGGKSQPVRIVIGKPLLLTDSNNQSANVTFVSIIGRSSLVEYERI